MKKMMGEFKFIVPAVLAISALLGGCKPEEIQDRIEYPNGLDSINICAEVRNCENYGSNQGLLRLLATANGNTYSRHDRDLSHPKQYNLNKIYDQSALLNPVPGLKACSIHDFRTAWANDTDYDQMFNWDAFKLEGLSYQPKDLEGKDIYVDSSNKKVTNFNPKTLEILKKENSLIFTPGGQQKGTNTFAHVLALQPTLTKVDFSAGRGEVVFDCQNPQGDGNINSQLSKFLLKETIKNKFKSLTNSATASKEVSETRSEKEQEIKDNKKESSIAL